MKIQANQKLVMIGDSITDAGRNKPIAEGLFDPLGRGYVTFVDSLVNTYYPERRIRIINVGTSGNTVKDLAARWQTDVLDLKPDWLSIMIGTNDIWRQYDLPKMVEGQVHPEEYEKVYDELLAKTRPQLKGLLLARPFFVESNLSDPMRARMEEYAKIVQRLAKKYDALYADPQAGVDAFLKHYHSAALAWDRVHPNQTGHMIIAKAFLDALGFEWNKPTV